MRRAGREPRLKPIGPKVVVTRPGEQALSWVRELNAHGVDAVAAPLIGIAEAPDPSAVDAVWASIEDWSLLVFVSPNAVSQFFARQPVLRAWPGGVRAASPGPGTSAILRERGVAEQDLIEPAEDAENFDSEALWQQLGRSSWHGAKVLVVRGEGGRNWLAEQLREAGADVQFLAAYRRGAAFLPAQVRKTLKQALARPDDHLWFFSSSEAVANLLRAQLLPDAQMQQALAHAHALATHPRIADAARTAGFETVLHSRPGLAEVVACIQSRATLECSSASRRAQ